MLIYIYIYKYGTNKVTSVLIMIFFLSKIDRKHIETHDLECLKESFGWVQSEGKNISGFQNHQVTGQHYVG